MVQIPNKHMRIRLVVIGLMISLLGFPTVGWNLWNIQTVKGEEYRNRAAEQQMRSTPIAARRGTIYDTNGNPLATSATVWTVFIAPADIGVDPVVPTEKNGMETRSEAERIADILSTMLEVDREKVLEMCKDRKSYYKKVKEKISKVLADEVLEAISDAGLKGVHIEEDNKRYYPYGNFASTVLGFTNNENKGGYGLEAYYDKTLSGTPGRVVANKNAIGTDMDIRYQKMYEAQDGNSLVLTLDEVVQHYLEKHLEIAKAAHKPANRISGIVMNVKTGEILGMATKSDFDPNEYGVVTDPMALARLQGLEGDEYSKQLGVEQNAQWRNKVVSDPYEPGSVFKLITLSAALETHAISPNDGFVCSGSIDVAGTTIRCWKTTGHGPQDVTKTLVNSCNPAFITYGSKLGVNNFYKYFEAFGLTEKTGIDMPGEATGLYHTPERMGPVELASSSFGQTFKVTPIQLLTATAATINGGYLLQPYIVKQVLDSDGNVLKSYGTVVRRQVISEETSQIVRGMAEKVVSEGSGNGAYQPGYRVGGKTGTSQKLDKLDEYGNVTDHVLSFMGFAPAEDPEIGVLVLIDEPENKNAYGSVIAAPVVGAIMGDILPYIGIEPKYTEEELEMKNLYVKDVVGQKPHEAMSILVQQGLKPKLIGNGGVIVKQVPEAFEEVTTGNTVVIYTEDAESAKVVVPNVVGMTGQQASLALINRGLNVNLVGSHVDDTKGIAVSQSVEYGTEVDRGTVITVEFQTESPEEAG